MSSPNFLNLDAAYRCSSGSSEYVAVSVLRDGSSISDRGCSSRAMMRQFETASSVPGTGRGVGVELYSLTFHNFGEVLR